MVFNFVSDERFRRPVTTTELEEFGRSWAKAAIFLILQCVGCNIKNIAACLF